MSKEGRLNRRNQIIVALIGLLGALLAVGFFNSEDEPIDKAKIEQKTWGSNSRNVK